MILLDHNIKYYLNSFSLYLKEICYFEDSSILSYQYDVIIFLKFIKCLFNPEDIPDTISYESIEIEDITLDMLRQVTSKEIHAFLYFLAENDYKPTSRCKKFYVLCNFFNYLYQEKRVIFHNPTSTIDFNKDNEKIPIYLSKKKLKKLFTTFRGEQSSQLAKRDYCILVLISSLGLRIQEVVNIDLTDFNLETGKIKILGKGSKERLLYLNESCVKALRDYLTIRSDISKKNKDEINANQALFITKRGNRISRRSIEYIVEQRVSLAGLDSNMYSAHKLRHTAATLMYQDGTDILVIQEILGHSSISSTEIYTHTQDKDIKRAINHNPLAHFAKEVKKSEAN